MAKTKQARGVRTAPAKQQRLVEEVEAPDSKARPSDPQEFDFLPRREGHVLRESEVNRRLDHLREMLELEDQDAGLRAWMAGDELLDLYNGFAERSKDARSFTELARVALDLDPEDVREYLRIRRGASKDDARRYGRRRLSLGLRLMKRFGLQSFDALCELDLPQPDGTTIQFPSPVRRLQAALKLLDTELPTPKAEKLLEHRKEQLRLARANDPSFDGTRMRYVSRDGEPILMPGALNRMQAIALAEFILLVEGRKK